MFYIARLDAPGNDGNARRIIQKKHGTKKKQRDKKREKKKKLEKRKPDGR